MGCTNSKNQDLNQYVLEKFSDVVNKISPEELNILKMIYFDLALRNSNKKIEKETFFVFFQKNGLWGHRLFKQFDMDDSGFVCLQQFVFSTGNFMGNLAKIIKADEDAKIGLLYQFFAFGNQDPHDGIVYSDFLRVVIILLLKLYNYSKQELKNMLQAQYLNDDDLKKQLIGFLKAFQKSNLSNPNDTEICLEMRQRSDSIFGSNVFELLNSRQLEQRNGQLQSFIGKPIKNQIIENIVKKRNSLIQNLSQRTSQKQNERNSQNLRVKDVSTLKKQQSGMLLQFNNKKITIKTGSYHSIVKKVAGLIFKHFGIDKHKGRLFQDQFVKWNKLHKDLYQSYYRGFNQHVWEMKDGKLGYLSEPSQIQSSGTYVGQVFYRGQITQKKVIKECKVFLQRSILFISDAENKQLLYNIVCLQGLQVTKILNEKLGYGIEVKHKNNIYSKKTIFFKSQTILKKWMQHLNDYKGFNVHEKYEIGMQIGAGKYSIVYECKQINNNKRYAIKEIDTFKLSTQQKSIISHESQIMEVFNHINLVKFRESIKARNKIYIVTELVEGKDLLQCVKQKETLSEYQAAEIAKQIINGINYLHQIGIAHRDLKPENIMIQSRSSNQLSVKIIDFGFANYIKNLQLLNQDDSIVGTPNYIAPEVFKKQKITEKVDNFSIGTIIYFMLSGDLPFNSNNLEFLVERTLTEKCQFVGKKWLQVSLQAKQLIQKLLQVNVSKRISLKQALQHKWFNLAQRKASSPKKRPQGSNKIILY